jgi:hypothetical protein
VERREENRSRELFLASNDLIFFLRYYFIRTEFILYNRQGVPCLFVYEHDRERSYDGQYSQGMAHRVAIPTTKIQLHFGSIIVFDQDSIYEDAMNLVQQQKKEKKNIKEELN